MKIGVLALQGAFREHAAMIETLGEEAVELRRRSDFSGSLGGLIIPGGESTVIGKLLGEVKLMEPLRAAIERGLPVFGTCAGLIVLAREIADFPRPHVPVLGVRVRRNAYGRQLDSFTNSGVFADRGLIPRVFIRAPAIEDILDDDVEVLATVDGAPVAVRQDTILATSFHPELTGCPVVHRYFMEMVEEYVNSPSGFRCRKCAVPS